MTSFRDASLLVIIGAGVSVVPNFVLEWWRGRLDRRVRWDKPAYELAQSLLVAIRELKDGARHSAAAPDPTSEKARLEGLLQDIRSLTAQLELLASTEVQNASRMVLHHAYAVMKVGLGFPDARLKDYEGISAPDRLTAAVDDFMTAMRKQLSIAKPSALGVAEILPDDPWHSPASTTT